jgi:predicted acyltransferase
MINQEKTKRILSIDALRGFDMFWITGGDAFFITLFTFFGTPIFQSMAHQLDHPAWTGFRFYDIIFALFLFIMGLSMPLSITKRLDSGASKKQMYIHIFRRTMLLYLLGLVYNGLFDFNFETLRYTGVLHRIAFTYFFASLIVMNFRQKGQLIWAVSITIGYWLILLLIPAPGFNAYNLTPEGNLAGFIDRKWLPGSFCCYNYGDNEGILTNFPAIASVLTGVLTGYQLMSKISHRQKLKLFITTGAALIVTALIWNFIYPVNKYLWTGSFVALTSGISLLALSLFYWLIDVKGYTKWAFPFTVIGMNPITIYVLSAIFDFGMVAKIFIHGFYAEFGGFQMPFYELCVLLVKWLFLYFLYKQKIFLKV